MGTFTGQRASGRRTPEEAAERADDKAVTAPEMRVLELLAQGFSVAGIATECNRSEYTVKTHLQRLYKKLGATGQSHAVAIAYQRGLLKVPSALVIPETNAQETRVRLRRLEYIGSCLRSGLAQRARKQCDVSATRVAALCGVSAREVEQWEKAPCTPGNPLVIDAYYEVLRQMIRDSLEPKKTGPTLP